MNTSFDKKATEWDQKPMRVERAKSIAKVLREQVQDRKFSVGLEYGCGTGLLGYLLQDMFDELLLADNSVEMLNILNGKIQNSNCSHLKTVELDLLLQKAPKPVDMVFSLMVLHHVENIPLMLDRWIETLNGAGTLMIADIEEEDGSYHPNGDTWHNGISSKKLSKQLIEKGLTNIQITVPYVIKKEVSGVEKSFPVFLMTAQKPS